MLPPRSRLQVWFIRVCSCILLWTFVVQLLAVGHLWPNRGVMPLATAIWGHHHRLFHFSAPAPPPRIYTSNGLLKVSCNGGLNQMRAAICDMVTVARFLNLTLVVPELDKKSFWSDPSDFADIFDVEHFIQSLRDEVHIIKRLPKRFNRNATNNILMMPPVSWSNEKYYLQQILPLFSKVEVIHFNKTDARLANNGLPIELQKLRCRVNYQALKFTPQIEALGAKLIEILRRRGPFVALHLRYEMDMLAFSGCTHGCSVTEFDELKRMRGKSLHRSKASVKPRPRRLLLHHLQHRLHPLPLPPPPQVRAQTHLRIKSRRALLLQRSLKERRHESFQILKVSQVIAAVILAVVDSKRIESIYKTDCWTHTVVVKGRKAAEYPMKVVKRVQQKTGRKVELISPIPTPEPEKEETKVEEPKPAPVISVLLRVHMHCESCSQVIKKRILKMKGVQEVEADLKSSEVTVKGVFDPEKLKEHIYKRTGKRAEVVEVKQDPPPPPPEEEAAKKPESEPAEAVEAKPTEEKKAEEGGGEEKAKGENVEGNSEKKEEGGDGGEAAESKEKNKEAIAEGVASAPPSVISAAAIVDGYGKVVGVMRPNDFYCYYPKYPVEYAYPPQIFSDENPNACIVM